MNKNITVKKALCIFLALSCLMMCLNIYLKAPSKNNRNNNLYFEFLQLHLPSDTKVVNLESRQYFFGDVVLQCDFLPASNSDLLKKIQDAGWKRFDGEAEHYQKEGFTLIIVKENNFYSLRLVDCQNSFNAYLYDLPKNNK